MEILSRASWGAKPPKSTSPFSTLSGWVIHWVGGTGMKASPTLSESQQLLRNLQQDAFTKPPPNGPYVDIQYNFLIDPMGRIFEGRGWDNKSGANGTTNSNAHEWAACYMAGPGVSLTTEAKNAFLWLTQQGAIRKGSVSTVRPHSAVFNTTCPGPDLTPFCASLQAHLHDSTVAPTEKVNAMFDPAISLVAWCHFTHPTIGKSTAGVDSRGHVYCLPAGAYQGGPYGNAYWVSGATGKPREAKQIKANSRGGYTVVASTGETYNYPA